MSSHKGSNQNTTGDKSASTASAGSSHSLRKRHSPNNPTAIGGSSNQEGTHLDSAASYNKLRKVAPSAAASSSKESAAKNSNKYATNTGNVESSSRRAGTRELSALIQPFPDRPVISEERLTRSKAKAFQQIEKDGETSSKRDNSGSSTKSNSNKQAAGQSKAEAQKSQTMATSSSSGSHNAKSGSGLSTAKSGSNPSSTQLTGDGFVDTLLDSSNCSFSSSSNQVSVIATSTEKGPYDNSNSNISSIQHHIRHSLLDSTTSAAIASANNLLDNNILTAQSGGASIMEPFNGTVGFSISSPVLMGGPLIPSTVAAAAAAIQQHHIITSSTSDLVGTFATQLAAAAVVVGTVTGGDGNNVSASDQSKNFEQQRQQFVDSTTSSMVEQQAAAAMTTTSLIGINRSAIGFSLDSKHNHHYHPNRAAAMFGVGAKSQRSSSFLSTLMPRMQHLLDNATTNSGSTQTARRLTESIADAANHFHYMGHHTHAATTPAMLSIVEGLKSSNEIRQSEAASELAEMLLLGNEESLPNMPIVEIVQALCGLLQKDNNFELMLTAARCITNMQEALPRALPVIAEAIPLLLSKLKRIEYIDVAEQSLIALEVMSRRSGKQILLQGGISSTISHVDFFSLPSQRLCYQICANCALYVTHNEFNMIKDCLADLTQRLVYVDDKRSIESICIFFNRIIENMRSHSDRLRQITGGGYEFLQNVQKLLAIQPSNISSNTYLALLKSIRYISSQCPEAALALVRMDFGNTIRVLIGPERIEGESTSVRAMASDSNERLGGFNSRPAVQLKEIITLVGQLVENLPRGGEEVVSLLHLFPLLVEIGNNSTCSQLRNESLNVMMKMVKMVDKVDHLEPILRDIPLAVYITQMLSSNRNLGILLSSLQLSRALLEKLPRLYIPLFEAEGVFHETNRLTAPIESPVIDRKPQHSRAAIAEHLLEGLMNSTAGGGGGSGVRVIIPPILLGQDNTTNQNHQQSLQQQQEQVCKEAKYLIEKFAGEQAAKKYHIKEPNRSKKVYEKLGLLANKIRSEKDFGDEPLIELKNLLVEQEITPFQFNQSGIPSALITYLTDTSSHIHPQRKMRLKRFATIFMGLNEEHLNVDSVGAVERRVPFEKLISKLLLTIGTIEQFQVRITNLSGIITSGSSSSLASYSALMSGSSAHATLFSTTLRGAQALRFFQTHQIRVNLRRHPKCKTLREWRHGRGSIKVDPFTSVSSIERYLLERGIGVTGGQQAPNDDGEDDSDISDEDQAIRQFALPNDDETVETIPSSIWLAAHTIYYNNPNNDMATALSISGDFILGTSSSSKHPAIEETPEDTPGPSTGIRTRTRLHQKLVGIKKEKEKGESSSSGSSSNSSSKESLVFKTGKPPSRKSPLDAYLKTTGNHSALKDPSMNSLVLLNVLYGLNSFWWKLFDNSETIHKCLPASHTSLISQSSFLSAKLNSKVSRQLSDFLTVATQQIPKWTHDLMHGFPFIFSFSTRRSFLFCTSFGRDRALMHLVSEANTDDGQEGAGHDATSRLIPRLERRKVSIKRDNVLKEAQQIFTQMNTSKAMLEVGFDGEVGTGFGPTLEFYSTLSRALQKHSLNLWHGKSQKCPPAEQDGSGDDDYVYAENGLYPLILSKQLSPKQSEMRIKRFEFIGRLLGQSLLDSRMLDLPLASAFFKWLIGEEESLGMEDFEKLEPKIFRSLRTMAQTPKEDFEDMDVYFIYPGDQSMELIKGGKSMPVTKDNCKQFMELVSYWRLIGGVRTEMEAVRRGFQLVINKESLRIFSSDEMELLFCGSADNDEKIWSKSALQHAIRPDHGYSYDSDQIKWLIDMICSYTREKRRRFLQFVTGSPRLPIGGFRGLNPPLTVVKKTASCINNEDELPSAMTCYNYLKIPPYESYETFVARFNIALEHVYSFYLT